MTETPVRERRRPPVPRPGPGSLLRRLVEVVVIVALYKAYAALRNAQGGGQPAPGPTARAEQHGRDVLHLERLLHLDLEHGAQSLVLAAPEWVVRVANVYYASLHLPVTVLVLLWLLVTRPHTQFAVWRNTVVLGTALALVGFAVFPTMPPRLLPGAGYVDTLPTYGGLWSQRTPVLEHVAHPYAAIPSLHVAWALWAGVALWKLAPWRWLRRLGPFHVVATAVVVVVTANHWLLDVVAGAAVLGLAWLVARQVAQWQATLRQRVAASKNATSSSIARR